MRTFTWDNGTVFYTIDSNYTQRLQNLIETAITDFVGKVNQNIYKQECIKFQRIYPNETWIHKYWVHFFPGNKCDSTVGKPFNPEKRNVSIGLDCMTQGVIQHELLHILGFWHEHSRTDRDQYVDIHWENVMDKAKENFRQFSDPVDDHLGLPYDYASIMHYKWDEFSKNGNVTVQPKFANTSVIGQRDAPTTLDLMKVRLRYKCMKHQNESAYRALLKYPIPLELDDNAPDNP